MRFVCIHDRYANELSQPTTKSGLLVVNILEIAYFSRKAKVGASP